jgi:hypothetical protein
MFREGGLDVLRNLAAPVVLAQLTVLTSLLSGVGLSADLLVPWPSGAVGALSSLVGS